MYSIMAEGGVSWKDVNCDPYQGNRRASPRFNLHSHNRIDVYVYDEEEVVCIEGQIANMSTGGALIECMKQFSNNVVGRRIEIIFKEVNALGSLGLAGVIVRVAETGQEYLSRVGICFSGNVGI